MISVEEKRLREKLLISEMIGIYCRKKHGNKDSLCPECHMLKEYAISRVDRCPFMANKNFCANCKVHCYSKVMQGKIKEVMRFSGLRIVFSHPILLVKHFYYTKIKEG